MATMPDKDDSGVLYAKELYKYLDHSNTQVETQDASFKTFRTYSYPGSDKVSNFIGITIPLRADVSIVTDSGQTCTASAKIVVSGNDKETVTAEASSYHSTGATGQAWKNTGKTGMFTIVVTTGDLTGYGLTFNSAFDITLEMKVDASGNGKTGFNDSWFVFGV